MAHRFCCHYTRWYEGWCRAYQEHTHTHKHTLLLNRYLCVLAQLEMCNAINQSYKFVNLYLLACLLVGVLACLLVILFYHVCGISISIRIPSPMPIPMPVFISVLVSIPTSISTFTVVDAQV